MALNSRDTVAQACPCSLFPASLISNTVAKPHPWFNQPSLPALRTEYYASPIHLRRAIGAASYPAPACSLVLPDFTSTIVVPRPSTPTMATEDARYRLSSQYRLWSFSPAKLRDLREKTNSMARPHITARLAELKPTDPPPEFLTAEEETVLLRFFTTELIRAAIHCELPTEIRATAAVFLKRFYVTNSLMTYPPMDLIKTCLFFGGKAEGYFARLSKYVSRGARFSAGCPEE